jgi:hypothetical protein
MINQKPIHTMTTEERLDEISGILAHGITRSLKRNEAVDSRDNSTGLHRQAKHSWDKAE